MQRTRVNSTILLSVGYDSDVNILELEFASKDVYKYYNVPGYIYLGLMLAASYGTYFNQHIKDVYDYNKVNAGFAEV